MSPEFSVQKFPTQIIKFCVALITKIIRQGEQEGFLKIDRMNKNCRMDRITLYNFRQDKQDFQNGRITLYNFRQDKQDFQNGRITL